MRTPKVTIPTGRVRAVGIGLLVSATLVSALGARYYAGYYFRGTEWDAPWGVSARIRTINPGVGGSFVAEWDCVILSYNPLYWVQLGYDKVPLWGRRYYKEKNDSNGHNIKHFGSPSPGSWHDYDVVHAQEIDLRKWKFYIDNVDKGYYLVEPYTPRDQQAFVETGSTSIMIDGSKFREISYFDGRTWRYWYAHDEYHDPPYHVLELYDYWFIAWGGG